LRLRRLITRTGQRAKYAQTPPTRYASGRKKWTIAGLWRSMMYSNRDADKKGSSVRRAARPRHRLIRVENGGSMTGIPAASTFGANAPLWLTV